MYVRLGHLGTAQDTKAISTAVSTTGAILAATTAIPFVAPIVGGIEAIISLFHIGQGCGQACITSADTEQIFEAAAQDVIFAGRAGMITQEEAASAIQWLLSQGDTTMESLTETDSQANAGKTNMDSAVGGSLSTATSDSSIPVNAPTVTLDPAKLQNSIFIQPGASGWYSDAVSAGSSEALQAIANATNVEAQATAASSGSATTSTAAQPVTTSLSSLFSALSNTEIIGGLVSLAAIAWLMLRPSKTTNPRRRRRLVRKSDYRV